MNSIDAFLHLYFFQIETIINNSATDLESVKFHSEEANTDEYLKIFFKSFLNQHNVIAEGFKYNVCINECDKTKIFNFTELSQYSIKDVFLPAELTEEHKKAIQKQRTSMYTQPDLYIEITNGITFNYITVELKSTKNDKIPGSSIQQISPYEWVIFVQHKGSKIKVVTGMYINSITERLPFPDRSPRPEIGFNTLSTWNSLNREILRDTLQCTYTKNTRIKEQILGDWHNFLAKEWLETVKNKSNNKNGKWFNHTIRLYSFELLEYYESITDEERVLFKQSLKELIYDYNKLNKI